MAYLRNHNQTPPGGWRYFQQETRKWFEGDQGALALAEEIAKHRAYRNLPRATPGEAMEDMHTQICERLGEAHCCSDKGENWRPIKQDFTRNLSGEQAMAFTKSFIMFAKKGGKMEDFEVAKARAEVCRGCHLNMKQEGCVTCSLVNTAIAGSIPTARQFSGVDVCAVCGCGLKAKLNMTKEVIAAGEAGRDLVYPEWCWVPKLLNA